MDILLEGFWFCQHCCCRFKSSQILCCVKWYFMTEIWRSVVPCWRVRLFKTSGLLHHEDDGTTVLQNVGTYLPVDRALPSKKTWMTLSCFSSFKGFESWSLLSASPHPFPIPLLHICQACTNTIFFICRHHLWLTLMNYRYCLFIILWWWDFSVKWDKKMRVRNEERCENVLNE